MNCSESGDLVRSRVQPLAIACILLSGCGGAPNAAVGFVNRTTHSESALWNLWRAAQQNISRQVDINPLEQELHNAAPEILPGDSRALNVAPREIMVAPKPDIRAATLYAETGISRPDPTGLIPCRQPCNVNFAPAYSVYVSPATHYAASWEFDGTSFDTLVEYEFENHILHTLGYDLRWR
jgi:hypothetical protein